MVLRAGASEVQLPFKRLEINQALKRLNKLIKHKYRIFISIL